MRLRVAKDEPTISLVILAADIFGRQGRPTAYSN